MDRRQLVAQRAREFFAERLDDVLHMIQQDRQEMRGWQEPAHVRAAVRRSIREAGKEWDYASYAGVSVMDANFGRTAGEPDRGQQREAMGQLLEAGSYGLEKVIRNQIHEITGEETLGLEIVLLLYGRPALQISEGRPERVPPFWNVLQDQAEEIELAQRGIGRIELYGHPEYDWAGTGFLVADNFLLTTRRVAEIFAEYRNNNWVFRPGISAWMDYRPDFQKVSTAGYRVRGVFGASDTYDVAILEVEPPQQTSYSPTPLVLASQAPGHLAGRQVYLIGYPIRDARRNEPEPITRIFRDVYNVKRLQPGQIRGTLQFRDLHLLQHDCAMLGQSAGAPVIDLETHQVIGLHLYGRYLETSTAVPLWILRDDPLFRRAGIVFSEANSRSLDRTTLQVERLARTRFWNEVRDYINQCYERAFGTSYNGGFNSFPGPIG